MQIFSTFQAPRGNTSGLAGREGPPSAGEDLAPTTFPLLVEGLAREADAEDEEGVHEAKDQAASGGQESSAQGHEPARELQGSAPFAECRLVERLRGDRHDAVLLRSRGAETAEEHLHQGGAETLEPVTGAGPSEPCKSGDEGNLRELADSAVQTATALPNTVAPAPRGVSGGSVMNETPPQPGTTVAVARHRGGDTSAGAPSNGSAGTPAPSNAEVSPALAVWRQRGQSPRLERPAALHRSPPDAPASSSAGLEHWTQLPETQADLRREPPAPRLSGAPFEPAAGDGTRRGSLPVAEDMTTPLLKPAPAGEDLHSEQPGGLRPPAPDRPTDLPENGRFTARGVPTSELAASPRDFQRFEGATLSDRLAGDMRAKEGLPRFKLRAAVQPSPGSEDPSGRLPEGARASRSPDAGIDHAPGQSPDTETPSSPRRDLPQTVAGGAAVALARPPATKEQQGAGHDASGGARQVSPPLPPTPAHGARREVSEAASAASPSSVWPAGEGPGRRAATPAPGGFVAPSPRASVDVAADHERTQLEPSAAFSGAAGQTAPGPATAAVTMVQAGQDAARHLSAQLAALSRPLPDAPVEITLDPEELGRVTMQLKGSDTSISVHLAIERPETAALMRRHIDMLAGAFREMGYAEVSFEFTGDHRRGEERMPQAREPEGAAVPSAEPAAEHQPDSVAPAAPAAGAGPSPQRIDLRI